MNYTDTKVLRVLSVDEDEVTFILSDVSDDTDTSEEAIRWHIDEYGDAVIDIEALAGLGVSGEDDNSRSLLDEAIADYIADNEEEDEDEDDEDED